MTARCLPILCLALPSPSHLHVRGFWTLHIFLGMQASWWMQVGRN